MTRLSRRRLLGLAAAASAAGLVRMPGEARATAAVSREVLPNGLVVIIDERRSADTVALLLTARAGARDDGQHPGVTVLTSRMIVQGTTRRPSETDLDRVVAQVGGSLSRSTTNELSSFSVLVPSREVDIGFDLLSDLMLDALLDPEALARQKQIALQDLAQRRSDPGTVLDDVFQETLFAGHPLSTPVLGTQETVEATTRDDLLRNRDRMWGASNVLLTVVGRIRPQDALAKAQTHFGTMASGTANVRSALVLQPLDAPQMVGREAGQQQAQFRVGFAVAGLLEVDRYPLTVLNAIMTGSSGRLFYELRSERGLAYVAFSGYSAYTDAGAWYASAGVDPENLEAALNVVRAEIERLRTAPPDPAEVAAKQGQIAGRQILADETNAARAGRLASQEILGTEPTEEFVRRIRQVTPGDVQRVAQTYLQPERALLVVVGPRAS